MENILEFSKFYFIGIGGISMSSLAGLLSCMGKSVSGSDKNKSSITDKLQKEGISVYIGYDKEHIKSAEVVIFNATISEDNPELIEARKKRLLILDRASFLGVLANTYKNTIAIAGSHGKTTTTAMISQVLLKNGSRPTIHIGGMWNAIDGNFKLGLNEYFVTEACEYKDSFLKLNPQFSIITNIEKEHLDYFKNLKSIYNSFTKFTQNTSNTAILPYKLKSLSKAPNTISIGYNQLCDFYALNIKNKNGFYSYDCYRRKKFLGKIILGVEGRYNIINSLACIAFCDLIKVEFNIIQVALQDFTNVGRRFEKLYKNQKLEVLLDYAHHPTEIYNCLKTAKQVYKNVTCIFQPHTYSRTKTLINDFEKCFIFADKVILLPTYASREKFDIEGSIEAIYNKVSKKQNCIISDFKNINDICLSNLNPCLIFVGAGDIENYAKNFVKLLKKSDL